MSGPVAGFAGGIVDRPEMIFAVRNVECFVLDAERIEPFVEHAAAQIVGCGAVGIVWGQIELGSGVIGVRPQQRFTAALPVSHGPGARHVAVAQCGPFGVPVLLVARAYVRYGLQDLGDVGAVRDNLVERAQHRVVIGLVAEKASGSDVIAA